MRAPGTVVHWTTHEVFDYLEPYTSQHTSLLEALQSCPLSGEDLVQLHTNDFIEMGVPATDAMRLRTDLNLLEEFARRNLTGPDEEMILHFKKQNTGDALFSAGMLILLAPNKDLSRAVRYFNAASKEGHSESLYQVIRGGRGGGAQEEETKKVSA